MCANVSHAGLKTEFAFSRQSNMNETIAHGHLFTVNLIDQMIGVSLTYD